MSFRDIMGGVSRTMLATFGEAVTYTPAADSRIAPVPVTGIFNTMFVLNKGDAHAGVETGGPAVFFLLEDLPANPDDDEPTLTIRGLDYKVIERRPDGIGGIVLALRLVT